MVQPFKLVAALAMVHAALFGRLDAAPFDVATTNLLTTPGTTQNATRAAQITATARLISNQQRSWTLADGTVYPLNYGPVLYPGSLAYNLTRPEFDALLAETNPNLTTLVGLATKAAPTIKTVDDYASFFKSIADAGLTPYPRSFDVSDEAFGRDHTTIRGSNMRLVTSADDLVANFGLSDSQVTQVCGASVATLRANKKLFVVDHSDLAQFNDPARSSTKYAPNVRGFFCYNTQAAKLLPVAIHTVDTKLVYTPFDSAGEWTLAKTALNTASINYQEIQHLFECHMVLEPLRVELLRSMAPQHPVAALFQYHTVNLYGNTMLGLKGLFSLQTNLDNTFGFGAAGSLRFVRAQTLKKQYDYTTDFPAQAAAAGLTNIPNHPFLTYSTLIKTAIDAFLDGYLRVYYATDAAVAADPELQTWATNIQAVPDVQNFPARFTTVAALRQVLSNVIFQTSIKHHAMNSDVVWHTLLPPYAGPALWKPLPTTKGVAVDILDYTQPISLLPAIVELAGNFLKTMTPDVVLLNAYSQAPFSGEPLLQPLIATFHAAMRKIDAYIEAAEASQAAPFSMIRPSRLPHYTWI